MPPHMSHNLRSCTVQRSEEGRSVKEIAGLSGCSAPAIDKHFDKHFILHRKWGTVVDPLTYYKSELILKLVMLVA